MRFSRNDETQQISEGSVSTGKESVIRWKSQDGDRKLWLVKEVLVWRLKSLAGEGSLRMEIEIFGWRKKSQDEGGTSV